MERIKPGSLVKLKVTHPAKLDSNHAISAIDLALWPKNIEFEPDDLPGPLNQFSRDGLADKRAPYMSVNFPLLYLDSKLVSFKCKERTYLPMIPPQPGEDELFDSESGFELPYTIHRFLFEKIIWYFTTSDRETLEDYFYTVNADNHDATH